MKNEFEKVFDNIAASAVPEPQDYTDRETGLLHCGNCHTPKECRITLFDKEKLMPCTCRCRQEQIAAEEQARKEQQRLDRIRRLKANGLQDRALLAYTFDIADNDNPAIKYAHCYVKHWTEVKTEGQTQFDGKFINMVYPGDRGAEDAGQVFRWERVARLPCTADY